MTILASLSNGSARWLNLRLEPGLARRCEDQDSIEIDLNLVSALVPLDLSWRRIVAVCENTVFPAYRSLKNVMEEDITHVARLLAELDPLVEETDAHPLTERPGSEQPHGSPSITTAFISQDCHSSDPVNPERRKQKRQQLFVPPIAHVVPANSKNPLSSVLLTLLRLLLLLRPAKYKHERPPAGYHTKTHLLVPVWQSQVMPHSIVYILPWWLLRTWLWSQRSMTGSTHVVTGIRWSRSLMNSARGECSRGLYCPEEERVADK
ncbi:hypothetical protein JVU11DRAFT_4783 [Chiua virens]|nr:hypothetical protein JVU11DRAFT_4783 [Chiua virens]